MQIDFLMLDIVRIFMQKDVPEGMLDTLITTDSSSLPVNKAFVTTIDYACFF